jgi:hypothetical protein
MKPSAFALSVCSPRSRPNLVPPPRRWLRVIIDDGDDEAEAKEKALAEHIAAYPEDAGLTVRDFNWIVRTIVRYESMTK